MGNMKNATKTLTVGLTALALAGSLTACGGGAAESKTFVAKGKIETLTMPGIKCTSKNPDVVKTGYEVKVQTKGNTVAMGEVGSFTFEDRSAAGDGYVCIYDFTVSGVPAGEKFYTVDIEKQGNKEVTEEELSSGKIVLVTHELDNMP